MSANPGEAHVYFTGANTSGAAGDATVSVPDGDILEYVPGSAVWRHNATQDDNAPRWTNTHLSDDIVRAGVQLGDAGPCLQCEATVSVQAPRCSGMNTAGGRRPRPLPRGTVARSGSQRHVFRAVIPDEATLGVYPREHVGLRFEPSRAHHNGSMAFQPLHVS